MLRLGLCQTELNIVLLKFNIAMLDPGKSHQSINNSTQPLKRKSARCPRKQLDGRDLCCREPYARSKRRWKLTLHPGYRAGFSSPRSLIYESTIFPLPCAICKVISNLVYSRIISTPSVVTFCVLGLSSVEMTSTSAYHCVESRNRICHR